jgi:mRNA interferase RelE/StbE
VKAIIFTRQAAKEFDALPAPAQEQVIESLSSYAGHGDVKALIGQEGYRLRIGRYRVIFDQDATTILAIYIGKRETTTYR